MNKSSYKLPIINDLENNDVKILAERKESVDNNRYRKNSKKPTPQTKEDRIKNFILRNSRNGFFTKISTIGYKFKISNQEAWDVIGSLLTEGSIEATHDVKSGEMKLCETGKTYEILGKSKNQQRAHHKSKTKEKRNR